MLQAGADTSVVDSDHRTALHVAAVAGHAGCVAALVAAGPDVGAATMSGMTPLHLAAWTGHAGSVRALVAGRASLNAASSDGKTALHMAVRQLRTDLQASAMTSVDCTVALVEAGADTSARNSAGETPLHWAVADKHAGQVSALLAVGGSIEAADQQGRTATTWPWLTAAQAWWKCCWPLGPAWMQRTVLAARHCTWQQNTATQR